MLVNDTQTHQQPGWLAPTASGPVSGVVHVPGSKSQTNRVLVLAALADAPVTLRNPLVARDSDLMSAALTALGAPVARSSAHEWIVTPGALRGDVDVDCGLAGTVMRFVPPLAALAAGDVRFDGDERARERPMAALITTLKSLGVDIADDNRGVLPFTIRGTGSVRGGAANIDASASSQFVSGLLLSGARYDEGLRLTHVGAHVPSLPHIDMTLATLRDFGLNAEQVGDVSWMVAPGTPKGDTTYVIEPDLSNAAPFLAAAVLTGGSVTIADWPETTTQPGVVIPDLLAQMGASVTRDEAGFTVSASGQLRGIDVDLSGESELSTTIAALALFASTPTTIRGVAHMRGHETDRLAALVSEINGLGGKARETADGLVIDPHPLHSGTWRSYADHRMATAGAIVGLAQPGVVIDDIASTSKTMPDFPGLWTTLVGGETA